RDAGLVEVGDTSGFSKWHRIYNAFARAQNSTHTGNFVMKFIQTALAPKRFVHNAAEFEDLRSRVNNFLAFRGWQLFENGKFGRVAEASTIGEARARADRLRAELERRKVHDDVLKFCRAELLKENYFH